MHEKQLMEKQLVGARAAELVEDGMVVGLGTGSTAYYMIQRLAERVRAGLDIACVATSRQTHELAASLGIRILDVNQVEAIDLTIDGADEIDEHFNAIKGGGGALLREKIVASLSRKVVIIADSTKRVKQLGKFPLPVEIVAFAHKHTLKKFEQAGYPAKIREKDGTLFVTDGGNHIVDLHLGRIDDPEGLAETIDRMTGVVDHGLFIDLVHEVLLAEDGDVRLLKKTDGE
ncbi:Ribose-5-phosphate isomerase A, rpiA [Thermobacillus xylanilyticus]|jgi:ribose 5-phosphate isomerase A|uniref:Ribose-5-phosphate isomerase A n=1 Tax=Thermobacillus xylanilyticus TaxID=76633 RepID=A0ABN7RQ66_THEXY|nr:Ribose-5-phosphate isomerase A, rpiA [Thermobacillus xylanilyticus]